MSCKFKSIKIVGFKEPSRIVQLNFSAEPVTVIYGENGSGKTTFLKILHAILNRDEEYLVRESVKEVELVYESSLGFEKKLIIKKVKNKFIWGDAFKELSNQTSILFGVNRGIISDELNSVSSNKREKNSSFLYKYYINKLYHERMYSILENELALKNNIDNEIKTDVSSDDWFNRKHLSVDIVRISTVKEAIIKQYKSGQQATSDKVKNAFFNTISSAVDIELEQSDYMLPDDFEKRLGEQRNVLIPLIEKLDKSPLRDRLLVFLSGDKNLAEVAGSRIFRAMVANIVNKVEEENIGLKSIDELMRVFNGHLYKNKRLCVDDKDVFIEFTKAKRHGIEQLSSGERHLLTFLTLFLIIGRDRNFFIIDEPEISLNMKWQRELMPLLSELSPNSQIIVATHSPSIAHKNSNYLVELL
ncbi:MAG: ATP-binding cassette domain-containing protein [Sphingobacteriaceae bacterium]|nr:MAG: ATP-binding cassette domain-containing protein [Sphingobacteriaceae bacterium]